MKNIFAKMKLPQKRKTSKAAAHSKTASASETKTRSRSARKRNVFFAKAKRSVAGIFSGLKKKEGSGADYIKVKNIKIAKRTLVIAIVIVIVAVPVIFAAAASNNQVAVISAIDIDALETKNTKIEDDQSDLFSGVASESDIESKTADDQKAPEAQQAAAEPTPEPEPVYVEYQLGDENAFVAEIQQRLMDLNYMERDEPTTLFGPMTSQAIQYFQRKNELAQDGIAGVETQKLLFSDNAKVYTVSEGAEGPDVESIQERLGELGYGVSSTGYFGSDTTKAVQYFQRMNGLTDDGSVGAETKEMLYSKDAEPSLEYGKKKSSSGSSSKKSSSGSSSSSSGGSSTSITANPGSVEAFIGAAEAYAGIPYVRGGKSSSGVDCSGFVYLALQASGNGIGYMTSGGWASSGYPTVYSMDELQRGDIVCFNGHVGIYLGGGGMIDASSSQGCVRYCSNIQGSGYWTSNFICGKRPL